MVDDLEKELQKWRATRSARPDRDAPIERRTVKIDGQDVMVVRRKPRRPTTEFGVV